MDECGFTKFGHVIHGYKSVPPVEGLKDALWEHKENYTEGYKGTKVRLERGKTWEPTSRMGGGWNDFWAGRFRAWRHFWRPTAETYPRYHRQRGVEVLVDGLVAQIRNPDLLERTVTTAQGEQKPWPNRAPEIIRKLERWLSMPKDLDRIAAQAFAHEYNLRHIKEAEALSEANAYASNQGLEVPWVVVQPDGTLRFTNNYMSVSELPVVRKLEMAGVRETFGTRPTDKLLNSMMEGEPLPLTEGFKSREREQAELQRVLLFVATQLNHLRQAEPTAMARVIPGAEGTSFEGKTWAELHDTLVHSIDRDYDHLRGKDRRDHLIRHETSQARAELYWKEFWTEFRSIFNIRRAQKEASEFTEAHLEEFAANPGATVTRFANSIKDPASWRNLGKGRTWLRGLVVFAGGITLGATGIGTFYTLTIKPGMEAWSTVRKWTDPVNYCASRFRGWEYEDCIKEWVQVAYFVEFQKSRYDPEYTPFEGRPEALAQFEEKMREFARTKTEYHELYDKALEIARAEEARINALKKEQREELMRETARKLASVNDSATEPDPPKNPAPIPPAKE